MSEKEEARRKREARAEEVWIEINADGEVIHGDMDTQEASAFRNIILRAECEQWRKEATTTNAGQVVFIISFSAVLVFELDPIFLWTHLGLQTMVAVSSWVTIRQLRKRVWKG